MMALQERVYGKPASRLAEAAFFPGRAHLAKPIQIRILSRRTLPIRQRGVWVRIPFFHSQPAPWHSVGERISCLTHFIL